MGRGVVLPLTYFTFLSVRALGVGYVVEVVTRWCQSLVLLHISI